MKKSITLAILALAGVMTAMAAPVSQQRACEIAKNFVAQQRGASASLSVNGIEDLGGVYLINFAPTGFAIVSADDNAEPIVGFSTESNLRSYQMPDNMRHIIDQAGDIAKLQGMHGTLNQKWSRIEKNQSAVLSRSGEEPVEPLITVKWNQGNPYNQFCPGEGSNKAVVGCVAVAMSQAMSVQRFPIKPQGQASYVAPNYGPISIDYEAEAPYNWDDILSGANKNVETARLLYHAGVSVSMDYGSDGSGIPSNQVYRITNALRKHFGYSSDVEYYWRQDYHGDWSQLLLNELYAGHALVYNAIDSKGHYGHSFNIDGYNGYNFHVNWGWGGYGNGYFSIDALADAAMSMNYDTGHVVVVGIGGNNSPIRNIELSDMTVEENIPAGSPVALVLVNGEEPTSDMKVELTGRYQNSGYLPVPFEYKNGLVVTTRPIEKSEGPIYLRVQVSLKSDSSVKLSLGFNIEVESPQSIEHKTSVNYDRATRTFTVHTKYGANYTVKNAEGATVVSGTTAKSPNFQFTRDQLSHGNNTLQITVGSQTATVNIVK